LDSPRQHELDLQEANKFFSFMMPTYKMIPETDAEMKLMIVE